MLRRLLSLFVAVICLGLAASRTAAVDISTNLYAAMDLPQINVLFRTSPEGDPLEDPYIGFAVQGFLDTGSSGIVISPETASFLGIQQDTWNGQPVEFGDVGVGGIDWFEVSQSLYLSFANNHPDIDPQLPENYTLTVGPLRGQIGPLAASENPLLESLDIFGMPALYNKTVVIDPKPVNNAIEVFGALADGGNIDFEDLLNLQAFLDISMKTYLYNQGTPPSPGLAEPDPGIPQTTHHIRFSYASFEDYTQTSPADAPFTASVAHNPIIGADPFAVTPDPDSPPPVKVSFNNHSATANMLFDTGGSVSMISRAVAEQLGVTYVPETENTDNPVLAGVPLEDQFTVQISGIGGAKTIAGFYLDLLLVRTEEGDAANDLDPNHLRFLRAPIFVNDITAANADTGEPFTLDGVFGMNFLSASASLGMIDLLGYQLPWPTDFAPGVFDFLVFDEASGTLGFSLLTDLVSLPADFNGDGIVDVIDLGIIAGSWQNPATHETGDANGDGIVDVIDLGILAGQWQASLDSFLTQYPSVPLSAPMPTPEPVSLLLLIPALAALRQRAA